VNWKSYWQLLEQKAKTPTTRQLNELTYLRAYRDFKFFAQYFFGHHCRIPFSTMHEDFFESEKIPAQRGRREAIAAPRGHAKTTFKVLLKCIHAIVYEYEPFILIIGHSASESAGKVRDILEELESNQRLIKVYGSLAPKQGQPKTGQISWATTAWIKVWP
jgi:hypothetical protein